jgi:hypothetical protein
MSSKNDENNAMIMVFAFIAAGAMILMMAVFALLAFIALVFTVLSLFAWSKPLTLAKGWTITPEEARAFVMRGVLGAPLLLIFCAFADILFDLRINSAYVPHILIAGYTLGSVGVEILLAQNQSESTPDIIPSQQQLPTQPQNSMPSRPQEPFRFASWDDEEDRG